MVFRVNKFAEWVKNNDRKHRSVAEKLGISTSGLHAILKTGQMPSMKTAYEIEKYTRGAVTMYDWLDHENEKNTVKSKTNKTDKFKEKSIK